MNGIYTNIAKKRTEQSKLPVSPSHNNHSDPPSPADLQPTTKSFGSKMSTKPQNHLAGDRNVRNALFEKPEKYTTHLEPSLIKKIKMYATEWDMKDYQVVKSAILLYFEKNK